MINAEQDMFNAKYEVVRRTSSAWRGFTTNDGADGVRRVTCVLPSTRSKRTSTSVIVALRPAM